MIFSVAYPTRLSFSKLGAGNESQLVVNPVREIVSHSTARIDSPIMRQSIEEIDSLIRIGIAVYEIAEFVDSSLHHREIAHRNCTRRVVPVTVKGNSPVSFVIDPVVCQRVVCL